MNFFPLYPKSFTYRDNSCTLILDKGGGAGGTAALGPMLSCGEGMKKNPCDQRKSIGCVYCLKILCKKATLFPISER